MAPAQDQAPTRPLASTPAGWSVPRPVFVDASGRRRRAVRRFAVSSTAAIVAAVGFLVAALLGAPVVPSALLPPAPHTAPPPSPVSVRAATGSTTAVPTQPGAQADRRTSPPTVTTGADPVAVTTT